MPRPTNYLSKTEDAFAVNRLRSSCNGNCKTFACPDARFARLKNGKIEEIQVNLKIVLYGLFIVFKKNRKIISLMFLGVRCTL